MRFIAESYHGDFIAKTKQSLGKRFVSLAKELEKRIRARFMVYYRTRPSVPGGYPSRLTGDLARSIRATPIRHGGGFIDAVRIEAGVGNDRKRATLFSLEKGNTITPKRSTFLAIPLTHKAKVHVSRGGTARDYPGNLSFARLGKKGRYSYFLVKDTGKASNRLGVRLQPVFWLTKGPMIVKPRKGLADAFKEEVPFIREYMERGPS